jgi:hypothetical protein
MTKETNNEQILPISFSGDGEANAAGARTCDSFVSATGYRIWCIQTALHPLDIRVSVLGL